MSPGGPRTMLALVLALGATGFAALASLLLLRGPGALPDPAPEALPLRSVGVVAFAASGDPSAAAAAARVEEGVARELGLAMPQARVVRGRDAGVRFLLEGELRLADGEAEVALTVIDARDGHRAAHAQVRVDRAALREPDAAAREVASTARRIVMAAMLDAAAE